MRSQDRSTMFRADAEEGELVTHVCTHPHRAWCIGVCA
jgi:hypothetical protein